ncbi:MAG: trypsin-like peptidase domain-containing protein [Deltaproteobacteria bacterium]|nr:trypsin-like peptidase domain-containing protein [Deltaproteobacteria bacterium]
MRLWIALVLTTSTAIHAAPTARQQLRMSPVVAVVELCRPAVVNIAATHVVTESSSPFDFYDVPRERKQSSVGSGSVIHERGYVLTNAHVIAAASELVVTTSSGKTLPAHVVAALPEDDIALVKIDLTGKETVPALTLGRSDDVMVGESVVAIGNPVGLGHTVTTGIISATHRELSPHAKLKMTGILQTDAAINPGNSGGPLLNVLGEQIGINTAIRGDAQNVGFAIGVDRVRALLPRLLAVENRTVASGARLVLGLLLEIRTVGDNEALVVVDVVPGTPAAKAGIEKGSTLVGVDGDDGVVPGLVGLYEMAPERSFKLKLRLPEGSIDVVDVQLATRPPPDGPALAQQHLGLALAELDPAAAVRLGLRSGVVVKGVDPGGPAGKSGILPGDLVVRLGSFGVRSVKDLAILEDIDADDDVAVRIVRIDRRRVFAAEVVLRAR